MLFSIVNPASLVAADESKTVESNEITGKIEEDKEVFTFDLSKLIKKESGARMSLKAMPARAPRRAPAVQYDTTVNIKTKGLNGKEFDWDALPNKEFKLIAKWETTDGQKHEKTFATITEAGTTTYNVGWPVDGTMKGNASVVTNYNKNIEVRVAITTASGIGGAGKLVFDIKLTELAEPRVNVKYVDPYGRPITDTADLPAATDIMPKVTADERTDVEIELPKEDGQINMRESDDIDEDELNTADTGLTYKVDNKAKDDKVTIGGKEYKLDISQPSAKEIGTIKMIYQKDVLVPPTKDDGSGDPVYPAEGYVRLTFDANENKQDGITGKHTAGAYQGKQKSYIDVKQGVQYDNANLQAAIKELATTGTKDGVTYEQDATQAWEDDKKAAIPTKGEVVEKTYYARYAKSNKDIIPYEPTDPKNPTDPEDPKIPDKDEDDKPIDKKQYDIVSFKTESEQKGTLTKGKEVAKKVISVLVKKNATARTFKDVKPETNPAKGYTFWYWDKDGDQTKTAVLDTAAVANGEIYTGYFIKSGDEVEPDDPDLPDNFVKVTYKAGTGVDKFADKIVAVEKGTKKDDLPGKPEVKIGGKATTDKDVEWTADPAIDAKAGIQKDTTLTVTASKETGKPAKPTVDPIKEGDKNIKVEEPKDGDKVDIVIPDPTNKDKDTKITVEKDDKGDWKDDKGNPINKEDGKLVIPVPDDADDKIVKDNKVTVTVTDKTTDKTSDPTEVTIDGKETPIPPTPTPEKSDRPIINPIYDSDDYVTGEGVPGATVEVRFPDGTVERVVVDRDGRWVAPVPYPLYDEEIVEARQIEFGKEPSDWVQERVRYDDEYWRERDRRDRDDKKEDTKKPSKVEPRWTPPALNARDHFSYIKGYGNNIFGPNRTITRAEVAMIFARLSINQSTGGAPQFKDVKAGDWYKTAVDIMARQGVIKGYEDGTFRPNQPITRREFAAIAARYAGNLDTWKTFRDVPPTDWAYKLINRVAGAGWINGYEDGTFRPNNNITRAEVVAIVNRMLNRKADAKYVDNNLMRTKGAFVDNMRSAWYYYDIYEAAFGHSFERQPNGVDEKWNRVTGQAFEIRER